MNTTTWQQWYAEVDAALSDLHARWSRLQVEILDRKRWKTRIELANALFDYREIWHNRQRRHSQPGMLTSIEFERQNDTVA